jgi:pimeloyl-ACP methyl ester carboxylesterase
MTANGLPREPLGQAIKYWVRERKLQVFGWGLIFVLVFGFLGLWKAGAVNPSPIAEPPTSFGVAGANLIEHGAFGPGIEVGAVGEGLTRTYIIRRADLKGPQPAVIFLHGFGSSIVVGYEPWLEHLANEGLTVIFPAWQQPPFPTDGSQNPRTNMFRGVALAVKAVPVIPSQVATLGFSAGASLAFDFAALGRDLAVPRPGLVYSIYPGRAFPGETVPILPLPPPAGLDEKTLVVTYVSRRDQEVGIKWGVQQYRSLAARPSYLRRLVFVTAPTLGSHYSPAKTTDIARETYWYPFDRDLKNHLGVKLLPDVGLLESERQARIVEKGIKANSMFRKRAYAGKGKEPVEVTSPAVAGAVDTSGTGTKDSGPSPDPGIEDVK